MSGLKLKYFVLKPAGKDIYAQASRDALRAYSKKIRDKNPKLADDLLNWCAEELDKYFQKISQ